MYQGMTRKMTGSYNLQELTVFQGIPLQLRLVAHSMPPMHPRESTAFSKYLL